MERLATDDFDCIVSDYDMPGQNGIEFLEDVRADYPDLPFILFTGKGSEEVASEAISAGVTGYLQKESGAEQYELLANRVLNAVEQYRSRRRAAKLDRIRTLASDINQALVRAESRAEVETRVCEIISDADPYLFAWIGEADSETDRIEPRTWAGIGDDYLDDITITADESPTGRGPGGTAIRERRVAISQDIVDDPEFEPWRDEARNRGFRAVAAVPLEYRTALYGELVVYAEHPNAFDEAERDLLAELGDDIAHAVHSVELRADLREERDRRRALFANAPNPVIAAEIHEGGDEIVMSDVNDAFEDVFGYDAEEVVGKDPSELIIPEERMDRHEQFRGRAAAGDTSVTTVERFTTDGPRTFVLHVIPYGRGDASADGLYAWYSDITTRKEREEKLRRRQSLFEAILETSIDGILVVDENREYVTWNQQFIDMWGMPEELVGDELEELGLEHVRDKIEDPQEFIEKVEYLYEHPREESRDEIQLEDGRVFDRYSAPVEADDGTYFGRVWFFRDITKQKQRERELARQNERLEQFASVVSHDLRNPLNVAQGRIELARDQYDNEKLDGAARAVDRSLALIDDLLTLAREGESVSDIEAVDLAEVCENSWQTVETGEATLVTETERTIHAKPSRLKQLLENLFRNAVEHGGESVTVTVGDPVDAQGFYVADDGPGIPDDERDGAFEAGCSATDDGTGFGLHIAREIAQAHDWDMSVTDSEAGGARFEVTGVTDTAE